MPIVGNHIKKITGKRGEGEGNISIQANVELKDVQKKDISIAGEKMPVIDFEFEFIVQYGTKAGGINILGNLFYTGSKKEMDDIAAKWKKDKKLEPDTVISILNKAMEMGYIESIPLAERLRLPPPLKMPSFTKKD
jgi:hypothetical protein